MQKYYITNDKSAERLQTLLPEKVLKLTITLYLPTTLWTENEYS